MMWLGTGLTLHIRMVWLEQSDLSYKNNAVGTVQPYIQENCGRYSPNLDINDVVGTVQPYI